MPAEQWLVADAWFIPQHRVIKSLTYKQTTLTEGVGANEHLNYLSFVRKACTGKS